MSSDYLYAERRMPAKEAVPSRLDRALRRLILIVVLVFAGELVWLAGIRPCLPLSLIEVTGVPGLDKAAVLAQAGIGSRTSYAALDAEAAEDALSLIPWVGSARVIKRFPDTVRIVLGHRRAAALTLARVNGRVCPVFFDKEGVIFKIGAAGDAEFRGLASSMPIISGLVLEKISPGARLPPMFAGLFAELERIHGSAPELLAVISEIRINRKAYDGFDLVLYPTHNPVKVRTSGLSEDTLRYMMLVLDVFSAENIAVEEIDFRTNTASYTIKEASSG
jgi:cell division protein FtsQ